MLPYTLRRACRASGSINPLYAIFSMYKGGSKVKEKEKYTSRKLVLYFSIIMSGLLILINIFRWKLVEILTVFLEPFLELIIGATFLVVLIWSIIHFTKNVRKLKYKALLPMVINLIALVIVIFVPFTNIMLNLDFNLNLKDREKIVSMVQSGELKPEILYGQNLIQLPEEYKHLSKDGGEIVIEKDGDTLKIFFFTFRGILDNFSGFAYISDNSKLSQMDFNGDFDQIIKKREHWFWGASR